MSRAARASSREESLRTWAGRLLAGAPDGTRPPPGDSTGIQAFLQRHGIGPMLAELTGPAAPPPDSAAGDTAALVAAEMARWAEFAETLKAFDDLRPIIFKGQALAYGIYPSPWLRPRTDVDALVERHRVRQATEVLLALDYRRADSFDGELVSPQMSFYKRRHGVTHVWDLHWNLSNRPAFADVFTYARLYEAAAEIHFRGSAFLVPGAVDALLIACLHLIGHHSDQVRLIWLYDVYLLATRLNDNEYREFLAAARRKPEVRAACHGALALTGRYIPSARLADLERSLAPEPGARSAGARIYFNRLLDDARALDRKSRGTFFRQHLFPTADYMVRRFGIRRRWTLPFWYGVRIARALPKLFKRR